MTYLPFRLLPLGVLALLLTVSACDLVELNENPNQPTEPTVPYLLTNAVNAGPESVSGRVGIAGNYWDDFNLGYFGNMYAQYWSLNQYTAESRYAFPSARSGVL